MPVTTSTTAFNPDLNELMEEAFERCGVEMRTGYHFRTAKRSLSLLITEWANRGINLWTVEQGQIPLIQGQYVYDLPNDFYDNYLHNIKLYNRTSWLSDQCTTWIWSRPYQVKNYLLVVRIVLVYLVIDKN